MSRISDYPYNFNADFTIKGKFSSNVSKEQLHKFSCLLNDVIDNSFELSLYNWYVVKQDTNPKLYGFPKHLCNKPCVAFLLDYCIIPTNFSKKLLVEIQTKWRRFLSSIYPEYKSEYLNVLNSIFDDNIITKASIKLENANENEIEKFINKEQKTKKKYLNNEEFNL